MSNWFADKLGPDPRRTAGAQRPPQQRQAAPQAARAPEPQRQQAAPAKSQPAPPPEPEKKKKKGWF